MGNKKWKVRKNVANIGDVGGIRFHSKMKKFNSVVRVSEQGTGATRATQGWRLVTGDSIVAQG